MRKFLDNLAGDKRPIVLIISALQQTVAARSYEKTYHLAGILMSYTYRNLLSTNALHPINVVKPSARLSKNFRNAVPERTSPSSCRHHVYTTKPRRRLPRITALVPCAVERFAGAHPPHCVGPLRSQGRGRPCLSIGTWYQVSCSTWILRGDWRSRRRPVVTHDLVNGRCRRQPEG